MELNSKKLERTSKIVFFSISVILSIFLILLTDNIMSDIDSVTTSPMPTDFENAALIDNYNKDIARSDDSIRILSIKMERLTKTIETVVMRREAEKESFDNWLSTRNTIGSPTNDVEVLARARKVDELLKVEQEWQSQLAVLEDSVSQIAKYRDVNYIKIDEERQRANELYFVALRKYDLKVFLIRLLIVTPILLIGIFFFLRFRRSKYWPLFQGYIIFSLYAFFFGLVPYLPSYGGYVRYSVGIILSLFAGYYAINSIRKYLEMKKKELEISSQERARNVQTEVAEKSLHNHICPSCGKDFILKTWESPSDGGKPIPVVTVYCRYCGLELFSNCDACGHKNFLHLPYCSNCGHTTKK